MSDLTHAMTVAYEQRDDAACAAEARVRALEAELEECQRKTGTIYTLNDDGVPTCPYCGSVEWASSEAYIPANEAQEELYAADDERVYIRSHCRSCGKGWHEEWHMSKIHLTEERPDA